MLDVLTAENQYLRSNGDLLMDYLDNIEEEYHKFYPDDPCPMEGGYKAIFERFVIESIGA